MIIEQRITLSVPVLVTVRDGEITHARLGDLGSSEILPGVDRARVLLDARAKDAAARAELDQRVREAG